MERMQVSAVTQINELWNEYAAAANAGDLERWIALWVEDGIQLPPGAARRTGKKEIREGMQPLFDLFDTRMAIYPEEVHVLGDQAYSHGSYEFVMTPKEGAIASRSKASSSQFCVDNPKIRGNSPSTASTTTRRSSEMTRRLENSRRAK